MPIVHGLFGLAVLIGFCWLVSENRRAVKWRVAVTGLAVQFIVAAILLKAPGAQQVFVWLNEGFLAVLDATTAGTSLVFGYIGGGSLPFTESFPGAAFVLAFQALPVILVTSALSAVLFYWRVLPLIVRAFAWVLQRSMGVGGAVGVSSAANIFVGMIEAPPVRAALSQQDQPKRAIHGDDGGHGDHRRYGIRTLCELPEGHYSQCPRPPVNSLDHLGARGDHDCQADGSLMTERGPVGAPPWSPRRTIALWMR